MTTLSMVSPESDSLTIRGHSVEELCRWRSFEEVAYLLWHGELPARDEILAQVRGERAQSGLAALAQAPAQVAAGYNEIAVAGGTESMTNAPHLLPGSRGGIKYGDTTFTDALDRDGLVCGFDGISMGTATERYQRGLGISRAEQDAFAAESHARAAAAIKDGRLAEEITPVTIATRKGPVAVEHDEGVRPGTTADKLPARPAARATR